jgi:hypothetical protein
MNGNFPNKSQGATPIRTMAVTKTSARWKPTTYRTSICPLSSWTDKRPRSITASTLLRERQNPGQKESDFKSREIFTEPWRWRAVLRASSTYTTDESLGRTTDILIEPLRLIGNGIQRLEPRSSLQPSHHRIGSQETSALGRPIRMCGLPLLAASCHPELYPLRSFSNAAPCRTPSLSKYSLPTRQPASPRYNRLCV